MLLFLLSLLFNPFGLVINWLPAIYLAVWPIIIQTLGRETLVTHAIVLILFILTCDISRQMMLKLIGFDLISLPLGIALLMSLTTDKGTQLLSYIQPLFSSSLTLVEPIFLLIEAYILISMIRSFNGWIAEQSNIRDEDSHDLSSWEPPLSRSSLVARISVILITILSYIGVYFTLQESKAYLGSPLDESTIPINFHHAVAALVTLQLIAVSATIYKEEGVLSESAMIALLASVPIFIASWSYHHLMKDNEVSSGSWSSYNPFSIFASGSSEAERREHEQTTRYNYDTAGSSFGGLDFHSDHSANDHFGPPTSGYIDFRPIEGAFRRMEGLDSVTRQLLAPILRRLIMIINSILGLSMDKLAKYYFGPDFWCFLFGRLLCLSWWALVVLRRRRLRQNQQPAAGGEPTDGLSNTLSWSKSGSGSGRGILPSWLPLSRKTIIKILLVLAYAQMIIQQMDNRYHLREQVELLSGSEQVNSAAASCCGASAPSQTGSELGNDKDLAGWFSCMWSSARACSQQQKQPADDQQTKTIGSIAGEFFKQIVHNLTQGLQMIQKRLSNLDGLLYIWGARWRSPIVQRLSQSIFIQLYYIGSVLFSYD